MALLPSLFCILLWIRASVAAPLCPIYGSVFPALQGDHAWRSAVAGIRDVLEDAFSAGNTSHGPVSVNDTYSVQVFSSKEVLVEYYNEGRNLVTSGHHGSRVDGDSVYRVASISKLYAVYALLAAAGDRVFAEPVVRYLPELRGVAYWDEVTVGALAGQVGGVVADLYDVDSIAGGGLDVLFPGAFPKLSGEDRSPCIANITHCSRKQFLERIKKTRFTYLPNTTPGYSNSAFVLIAYILETITRKSFGSALKDLLFEPLSLHRTYAKTPKQSSQGVIIHNATFSGWDIDISEAAAEGGIFASATDLSTLGRSILSSSILSRNTTRAWIKPTSFTSSPIGFVGRPWEIYRSVTNQDENRVVDIYTKGGNIGIYTSLIALVPDLDVGFTILIATEAGAYPFTLAGVITDALLPAVEEAARRQTDKAYTGTYRAKSPHINSSVVLSSAEGKPGLKLEAWVSNGTDMFAVFESPTDFRLYPSNAGDQYGGKGRKASWKAVSGFDLGYADHGAFSACPTWFQIDRPSWGLFGIDNWVFTQDKDGVAREIEIPALKVRLERVEG